MANYRRTMSASTLTGDKVMNHEDEELGEVHWWTPNDVARSAPQIALCCRHALLGRG